MKLPLKMVLCAGICLTLGFLSGYFAGSAATDWYQNLNKPFFQPPPWVFGPAWTLLYILMGISVALIWHEGRVSESTRRSALTLFGFQFILNLVWSPIFFKMEQPTFAFIVIILLVALVIFTLRSFGKINKTAMYLLVPYLGWLCFATALNASIVYLNP